MDSASTLTLTHPVEHTPYVFTPNNVKNTTVFVNADPLYAITTDLVADTHTHVDDARTGRRIATITRRTIFPDTVTFTDRRYNAGKPINMHTWLRKGKLPDGYPVHLMQTPDIAGGTGHSVWTSDATQRLGLYRRSGDHDQMQCIAYLQPASPPRPLMLFLDPIAEPIRDEILVACLILEQRLRIMERDINVGGGKFEQNRTVFEHHVQSIDGWTCFGQCCVHGHVKRME